MKKLPKLKPKELKFVEVYIKHDFNGPKAVREVYGVTDGGYARLKAHRLITKDNVANAIEIKTESLKQALINQGVTPEKIAFTVDKLLTADDYTANDKGLRHATNIYGVVDPDDKPKGNTTYNFIFSAETQEKVRKMEEEIKAQLIKPHVQQD